MIISVHSNDYMRSFHRWMSYYTDFLLMARPTCWLRGGECRGAWSPIWCEMIGCDCCMRIGWLSRELWCRESWAWGCRGGLIWKGAGGEALMLGGSIWDWLRVGARVWRAGPA